MSRLRDERPGAQSEPMRRAIVLCLLFAGCRPPADSSGAGCGANPSDPLGFSVADAQLVDLGMWQAGLGVGHIEGDATLLVHDLEGEEHDFDARLDGTMVGLVADASFEPRLDGAQYPFDLPEGGGVSARGLLGSYEGPHVGLEIGAGVQWRNLANSATGVNLLVTSLAFGLGATPTTYESLDLELWDDPLAAGADPCAAVDGVCDSTCASDPDC